MTETRTQDPRDAGPEPPFPEQHQDPPGTESEMEPRPDYGLETYRGSGRLEGRRAIVTGGDSGIGRAVALAYAREGADVLIAYLDEDEDAQEAADAVRQAGRKAVAVAGDLGDHSHCERVVARAVEELGGIDVLVNNAARQTFWDKSTDIPPDEVARVFASNVFSMFNMVRAARPHLQEGASIINVSSIQAFKPTPNYLHYAATKGAILTYTKGLATELIEDGIRVNGVAPGPVWTPLVVTGQSPEKTAHFAEDNPVPRPAQPAELAPVFVFLASDESRYVVGEFIGVTGGKLMPS